MVDKRNGYSKWQAAVVKLINFIFSLLDFMILFIKLFILFYCPEITEITYHLSNGPCGLVTQFDH